MKIQSLSAFVLLFGLVGNLSLEGKPVTAAVATSTSKPIRAAVFVDPGARGIGMFRWIQLAGSSPQMTAMYLDSEMIRQGALDNIDLLFMPGGSSSLEYKMLQDSGAERLKEFVRKGGAYIGSCAGCYLVMEGAKGKKRCGIVPFRDQVGPYRGGSILTTRFTKRAEELMGVRAGDHSVRYHGGPKMVAASPIPDANFEVFATFVGDINTLQFDPCNPMTGTASVVGGNYGEGHVLVFADHPEYFPATWDIVRGAIKFTTGRDVTWNIPQKKPGQLVVGVYCSASPGPKDANVYLQLLRSNELDIIPITESQCQEGILRHIDALVIPGGGSDTNRIDGYFSQSAIERRDLFLKRGGKVVTWGKSAAKIRDGATGVYKLKSGDEAVATLLKIKTEAVAVQPETLTTPAQVALYAAPATGCAEYWKMYRLLEFSPLYSVTLVTASDIQGGKLSAFDLLVIGNERGANHAETLGEKGCVAIRDFIRNGGSYYGIGDGASLLLGGTQTARPGIADVVPFCEEPGKPDRGWSETSVRFQEAAFSKLGIAGKTKRTLLYWGGPVMVPSAPVPEANIEVLITFIGNMVNTVSGKKLAPMAGRAAMVGGTFGKGRLVLSGVHPEATEESQELVCRILQYLTNRKAEPIYPDRKKGAVSVAFNMGTITKQGMELGMELCHDTQFDLVPVTEYEIGHGALEHADVVLFPSAITDGYSWLLRDFLKKGGRIIEFDPEKKSATKPQQGQDIRFARNKDEVRAAARK
ncbi:MAG: hypothetical protein IKR48_01420 [Kiritimatiellae bacterium]|nr:hypothetical protein [Kiritimatiellia bacterium]